jgi:hypothetical protein
MRMLAVVLMTLAASPALAAPSLTALLNRAPPPPSTAPAASAWVGADGQIVNAAYLSLQSDLKAGTAVTTDAATKGAVDTAAGAGVQIDQSRLDDPAYQAELQARYSSMTPDQAMAMAAQAQSNAMADARRTSQDPPEVVAAYTAYQSMMTAQATSGASHYSVVESRAEQDIVSRYDAKQDELTSKLQDCNECTPGEVARVQANNKIVWKQKLALADAELGEWAALFARAKATRATLVAEADARLAPTGYGAKAVSPLRKQSLNSYQMTLLGRIGELLDISARAAQRGAAIEARSKMDGFR